MSIAEWSTVEGIITKVDVEEGTHDEAGKSYEVNVKYKYNIDRKEYIGTVIHQAWPAFSDSWTTTLDKQSHYKLVSILQPGTKVKIRYNPARPSEASLASGFLPAVLWAFIAGVGFVVSSIMVIVRAAAALLARRSDEINQGGLLGESHPIRRWLSSIELTKAIAILSVVVLGIEMLLFQTSVSAVLDSIEIMKP